MSTKIHPKNVHENSPKVSTRIHPFCPRKFAFYVHEKSATQQNDQDLGEKHFKSLHVVTRPSLNCTVCSQVYKEVFSSIYLDAPMAQSPLEGIRISFPRFPWTWALNIEANTPMRIKKSSDMLFWTTNTSRSVNFCERV